MAKPNNSVKGLRVGRYRITPLGLIVLGVLLVAIIAAVAIAIFNPFGGEDGVLAPRVTPTPTVDPNEVTPPPTPTPSPSPTPEPEPRSATIRSLGEIAMQLNLLQSAVDGNTFEFDDMFSEISDIMGNADYTVADVEGTLGGTKDPSGNNAQLITPPSLIGTLQDCGVDMLMLANDHALDGGFAELQAEVENCKTSGMDYVGAAASDEEKSTPVIKEINGIKVAFLAYTETLNDYDKKTDEAATRYGVNLVTKSNAKSDVKAAREAGADVIVCYVSWGQMLSQKTTNNQKLIAQVLVKAGVDVIIGYGPHLVQPAMWLENTQSDGSVHRTLMLLSAGNFLSDQHDKYTDSGLIFQFTIQETGSNTGSFTITNPIYIPTYVWRAQREDDGKYDYRTLPVGKWLEEQPEGMAYADVTRMREVWAEIQTIMGSEVATIAAE